ncbi:uncharacterized protein LOC135397384 isoform X2 [Ornithodoros turicata]|uniref:uncharacterized protein LOC135397384 isoform X2 n=1 Tax=Ornithodoros turicata TaxID=34597 RepID=UPI0031388FF6
MLSFFGFVDLRTGNIIIGLLSVLQCIGIILAGSASYVESETMMYSFHLVWVGSSSVLLVASLAFLKGVGDKLPKFMVPWLIVIVPYILWIIGAGIWAALYSKIRYGTSNIRLCSHRGLFPAVRVFLLPSSVA